jgi:fucose permease
VALVWLWATRVEESAPAGSASVGATLGLLRDKYIIAFFVGILVLVGVDVGINTTFPKLLMERCGIPLAEAGLGNSVYFFARTIGAFAGGVFLLRFSELKFFKYSTLLALVGLVAMFFARDMWLMLASVSVFGLGYANLFAIIFSLSLKRVPDRANEISALLIMGVSGGAILPPLLGVTTDAFGTQVAAVTVIAAVWLYMVWLITRVNRSAA